MFFSFHSNISPEADSLESRLRVMDSLVETPEFLEHRLSVYSHVPAAALTPGRHIVLSSPERKQTFDYLICQGAKALLAVNLTAEADNLPLPNLMLLSPSLDLELWDIIDMLRDAVSGELKLRDAVSGEPFSSWQFAGKPLNTGQYERFAKELLLYCTVEDESCSEWFPTPYGEYMGLMAGGIVQPDGETVRYGTFCTDGTLKKIEQLLAWREAAPDEMRPKIHSLDQRLRRIRNGFPGTAAHSAALIRQMASRPLDDFLKDFPEDLERLRQLIPTLGPDAVYLDAAVYCGQLTLPEFETSERMDGDDRRKVEDIMEILMEPFLPPQGNVGRVIPLPGDIGPEEIGRVLSELPDGEAEPSPVKAREGPASRLPFAERVSKAASERAAALPLDMTIAGYYEGVSILAGTKYPLWLLSQLEKHYSTNNSYLFFSLLRHAKYLKEKNNIADGDDYDYYGSGCALMFQLLIEPFCLIDSIRKEI